MVIFWVIILTIIMGCGVYIFFKLRETRGYLKQISENMKEIDRNNQKLRDLQEKRGFDD